MCLGFRGPLHIFSAMRGVARLLIDTRPLLLAPWLLILVPAGCAPANERPLHGAVPGSERPTPPGVPPTLAPSEALRFRDLPTPSPGVPVGVSPSPAPSPSAVAAPPIV